MKITGSLIFRLSKEDGARISAPGTQLWTVTGIVGIRPGLDEQCPVSTDHQYVVMGKMLDSEFMDLMVYLPNAVDRTEIAKGTPLGALLMEPIWRV